MLKKYQKVLLLFCFILSSSAITRPIEYEQTARSTEYLSKDKQLFELQAIAEHINKVEPLHDYMLAVPAFISITNQELHNFLNSIPSPDTSSNGTRKKKRKQSSMLSHLQNLWQQAIKALAGKETITSEASNILAQIREDIKLAFNHDITTISQHVSSFIKKAVQQETLLIVHPVENESFNPLKSAFPIKPTAVNRAIGQVVASYYSDISIQGLLHQRSLPKAMPIEIILQHFIVNNPDEPPLTSGICCPYDITTNTEDISTIHSVYGNQSGLKDDRIAKDIFYIYQDRVYPVIAKKVTRLEADTEMQGLRIYSNKTDIQEKSTLDVTAVQELSRATQKITEHLNHPVCISFIKYSRTIYLLSLEFPKIQVQKNASYIDDLYIKKALKDDAVSIDCVTPQQEVVVIKKRSHIILAPDLSTFFTLYHERKNEKARIGIIKKSAEPWSNESRLLKKIDIPVIWSSQFDEIKRLIDTNRWPIIIDPQHKLLLPHKKRKGFCTLFQTIEQGIKDHPGPEYISVIPSFIETLTKEEQQRLHPDEFFSGVTMAHLFDLIKHAPDESALQALRTVLYRLQLSIKRVEFALQESPDNARGSYLEKLSRLQDQYAYIEQVAFQLYTILHTAAKQHGHNKLKRLFLVNILTLLITQQPDSDAVNNVSFNRML